MKKIFCLLFVTVLTLFTIASCGGGNVNTTKNSHILNGNPVNEPVQKGNYIVYVDIANNDSRRGSWDYENWCVKDADDSLHYTLYFFSVDKLFGSAEELEDAQDLKPGMTVGITSYLAGVGRGAGIYTIVDKKPSHQGRIEIEASSAFAELKPFEINGDKIITVDQFGAYGDGKEADDNKINRAMNFTEANVIEFESSVYMQENTIKLTRGDVRINGNGAEIRNRYDRIVVNRDFMISGSADSVIKNIVLENLTLKCTEDTGAGALYNNADHIQLSVSNAHFITVRNCSMLVPQNDDHEPLQVASVWMNGGISDIVFENNYLQNFSDSGMGGGLWFSASQGEKGCKNLIIRNNHVEKNSCDEVFALFFGDFENVIVENNYFYTHSHVYPDRMSENGIGFGAWAIETHCKNVKFSGNEVRMSVRYTPFIFSQAESVEISNNKIYLTTNFGDQPDVQDTTIIEKAIFRLPEYNKYSVTNSKIFGNYIEVNCGEYTQNGYNLNALTEGMSDSVEYYDNEYVLNCIVNKFIGESDYSKFYNNKITINGSLLNNNFSDEAKNANQIIINQK